MISVCLRVPGQLSGEFLVALLVNPKLGRYQIETDTNFYRQTSRHSWSRWMKHDPNSSIMSTAHSTAILYNVYMYYVLCTHHGSVDFFLSFGKKG